MTKPELTLIQPGQFNPELSYYDKVLNAQLSPLVRYFLKMGRERLMDRYLHLHPDVDPKALAEVFAYTPRYFIWGGADLINTTNPKGHREFVLIETNSCPSGQKSMPLVDPEDDYGSYGMVVDEVCLNQIKSLKKPGAIGVIYDKNAQENRTYAAVLADKLNQPVYLIPVSSSGSCPYFKVGDDDYLYVQDPQQGWLKLSFLFRYVTQKPWTLIPATSKTLVMNHVIICLAGGRNKALAAKAYDFFNGELLGTGLSIKTPETIWEVSKEEIPLWLKKMGGYGVIKIPYSNAGQGIYTITSQQELDHFMATDFHYDQFIVQSLIGNYEWSSLRDSERYFHIGTLPNKQGQIFVADLRLVIGYSPSGYKPMSLYSRRSLKPLVKNLEPGMDSWPMLGTNLSYKGPLGEWKADTSRLVIMDNREFNRLGLGIDDLIEAFVQTLLAVIAIDKMATNLTGSKGKMKKKLFKSLVPDKPLLEEILY